MSSDSTVERVAHRGRETITHLLTADNCSIRETPDGALVVELFEYGKNEKPLQSYRFTFGLEDRARLRSRA